MFIKYILSAVVFLSLFFVNTTVAQAANSILSTTVRKTSADSLNVTFFTKAENSEAPIVKDKGNNQYVILLPNLTDSAGKQPDFRTASELVSDVNIKTINEGAVTYTKVTLTTKRPVKINAETRKTSQSVSELSGVNDIVSKVNLINQDIQASKTTTVAQVKTTPALPKMNNVQDILNNKNLIGSQKTQTVPAVAVTSAAKVSEKSLAAHVPANTKDIKKDVKNLQNENIKNVRAEAVKNIDKMEQNVKTSVENNIHVNDEEPEVVAPIEEKTPTIQEVLPPAKGFDLSKVFSSPIILFSTFILGGLLFGMLLLNKVKASLSNSEDINNSFIERMNTAVPSSKKDYSKIAQDPNLSWQEKYASFKEGKTEQQKQELHSHIGIEVDDDLDIVEDYAQSEADELEFIPLLKDTPNPFASAYQDVHSSGDVIAHSMKRSLRAFDEGRSLNVAQRNTGLKNRFKAFETDPVRHLNRNMSALLDTVIQMEEEVPQTLPAVEPRIEAAVEPPVMAAQPAPEIREHSTSPIQRAQAPAKRKMKIKESRAIDENKGFYLVDMEDKLALMGRINDKFTVLKKFDDMEKKTLQVRRDKDNLYMVRTDGFKALVDVAENKMGVLAEL